MGKHRLSLILIGLAIVVGASLPPFMTASCLTRQQTPAEVRALENLRAMTRNGVLPADEVVARIESDFPRSKAAALARLVRARIKINSADYSGAAALLDTRVIGDYSSLADYALFMRANALEQAGQLLPARSVYQELIYSYPSSLRTHEATLRVAELLLRDNQTAAVPLLLKDLAANDDAAALLLTGRAAEQLSDSTRALAAYRRLYFFAPSAEESSEAAKAIQRLGSTTAPASVDEARERADRLFSARKFADALQAYTDAFAKFAATTTPQNQLRRGASAFNARRNPEAIASLSAVPTSAGETRAEALFLLAQTYARARQWDQARATLDELRRSFPASPFTPRAWVAVGNIADDAKNSSDASYFLRTAITAYSNSIEVAQAQFDLAWQAHEARDFQLSSKMLTEHLALYVDKNTDNRGRAGYWAARDSERAGKLAEARALYEAMLARYDANWYGYLAKQRLDAVARNTPAKTFAADSMVARAVANLQTVTVAEESAGTEADLPIIKADQLSNVGLDDWALKELSAVAGASPDSPRINLAIAGIYRSQEDNVRALNTLRRSFPDYSQMKPEEMTREQWDVFYPLAYWDIIVQESRARNLDPFQVAGLIRQETVFNSRARSPASAYGLMQVLVPTGRLTAKKYGVDRAITAESLYEPRLNIQLGTAYLRDQIDKFGRIEYVAAAYNAGPLRVPQWRASLPAEIDEWVEAIPFKETRGYVQGVVRNRLQYQRLYDLNGKFRPEVGTRAVVGPPTSGATPPLEPANPSVRKRRISGNEYEE
ncbi:MAG TPA: transglycosylase SLT domain-containing protein [Pyrinomonadaceae bacterium]|nr:transglycosylase SLT domain-containing protein [Pyrinomonadaceae bacterium]